MEGYAQLVLLTIIFWSMRLGTSSYERGKRLAFAAPVLAAVAIQLSAYHALGYVSPFAHIAFLFSLPFSIITAIVLEDGLKKIAGRWWGISQQKRIVFVSIPMMIFVAGYILLFHSD